MLVAVLVLGHQDVLGMHHNRPAALQKHLPVVRMAYQILGRTGGVVHIHLMPTSWFTMWISMEQLATWESTWENLII